MPQKAPAVDPLTRTMSLFSSLIVFYPGSPPRITLREARSFCDRLRDTFSLRELYTAVEIKYGRSIDQDAETINKIEWTGRTGRCVKYDWDHAKRASAWSELWPKSAFESRNLYRAYIGLGGLPRSIITELTAMRNEKASRDLIVPDSLSFQIDPVIPETLGAEELFSYGYIQLSFAGNGFFSWQPLSQYWQQVRASSTLLSVLRICRETFPVPQLPYLDQLESDMEELFLNREDYQPGDWIVSVTETG